jgi:methionine synthase I (cobalamin-dependent)
MKKKTMTTKNTRKQIKETVTAGADIVKEETIVIMDKVKRVASEANRKGKAAVRAIRS